MGVLWTSILFKRSGAKSAPVGEKVRTSHIDQRNGYVLHLFMQMTPSPMITSARQPALCRRTFYFHAVQLPVIACSLHCAVCVRTVGCCGVQSALPLQLRCTRFAQQAGRCNQLEVSLFAGLRLSGAVYQTPRLMSVLTLVILPQRPACGDFFVTEISEGCSEHMIDYNLIQDPNATSHGCFGSMGPWRKLVTGQEEGLSCY
jgi:hypothetical protein